MMVAGELALCGHPTIDPFRRCLYYDPEWQRITAKCMEKDPELSSVAVLPFRNVKADPELDYITEGVTKSLIAALSETTSLRVMSRASVFRFKDGRTAPVSAIARKRSTRSS